MTLTKCEAGIEGLGENGVVVTFDQSPKRILADLDGLAFDTAAAVDAGTIGMVDFRLAWSTRSHDEGSDRR